MALAERAQPEPAPAVVLVIVTIGLEWRLRCPQCGHIIVTAFGQRSTFDETHEVGRLNTATMRRQADNCSECGYHVQTYIRPLPIELEHSVCVVDPVR